MNLHESLPVDSEGFVLVVSQTPLVPLILLPCPPQNPQVPLNVWLWDSASSDRSTLRKQPKCADDLKKKGGGASAPPVPLECTWTNTIYKCSAWCTNGWWRGRNIEKQIIVSVRVVKQAGAYAASVLNPDHASCLGKKPWLWTTMKCQDEERFTFWIRPPWEDTMMCNATGTLVMCVPCWCPRPHETLKSMWIMQFVLLTEVFLMSFGFVALGGHLDVSNLCSHLRRCWGPWSLQLLRAIIWPLMLISLGCNQSHNTEWNILLYFFVFFMVWGGHWQEG